MQDVFITHPRSYRVMQERGPKYLQVNRELTSRELSQHLLGQITVSASLISNDGRTVLMGLDIDQGGIVAGFAALNAAEALGVDAIFIHYPPAEDHDGGMLYARCEPSSWLRAARLMSDVREAAALDAEVFPSTQPFRLPFGVHRRSNTRGVLYTHAGQVIELDQPDAMQQAAALWGKLAIFPAAQLPDVAEQLPASTYQPQRTTQRDDLIAQYNTSRSLSDVVSLLERAQARFSYVTRRSGATLRCGCGMHQNGDKHPSLEIRPATNDERRGWNIIGHAPNCHYYATRGRACDPFNVLLDLHDGNWKEALREARAAVGGKSCPPTTQSGPAMPESPPPAPDAPSAPVAPAETPAPHTASLDAYIEKHGSSGIKQIHQVFRKVGREITNERLNSEVQRRRGAPYNPDHLRKLRRDYEGIVARWDAGLAQATSGENVRLPMHYMEIRTCEKQSDPSAVVPPAVVPPAVVPPAAPVAPVAPVAPLRRRAAPAAPAAPSEASFEPPKRRPLPTNPKERTMEQRRRRIERLERQSLDDLERQRAQFVAMLAHQQAGTPRYRVFEAQLAEVEREIGRRRSAGLAAMLSSSQLTPQADATPAATPDRQAPESLFLQVQTNNILSPDCRDVAVDWDYLARLHRADTPEAHAGFERHCLLRGFDLAVALGRFGLPAEPGNVAVGHANMAVAEYVAELEPSVALGAALVDSITGILAQPQDGIIYGPVGAIVCQNGAAYVPAGAEAWYNAMMQAQATQRLAEQLTTETPVSAPAQMPLDNTATDQLQEHNGVRQ